MKNRYGFSLIEVVVVLTVGAILLSISVSAFGDARAKYSVREARNSFAALAARARAQAIEYGQTMEFMFDVDGDSVWVERNDTTLEMIRLMDEYGVGLSGTAGAHTLCYNSRGYGVISGCSSFSSNMMVKFVNSMDSTRLVVQPFGQVVY